MKEDTEITDFAKLQKIVVGVLPGDGIGPIIMEEALRVLRALMKAEVESGRLEIRVIPGMTIEERAAQNESLPAKVLEEVKKCNVLLKGPMVTPRAGEPWPNLVSANSLLRRSLELFAAVRPIKIPEKGIDWAFFRENIEGEYIWGNKGIQVNEDLAVDFKVQTREGSERIARAAFDYARKNGKHNVTVVTKANIVKLADGNFIKAVRGVGEEYPEIEIQERLVDAMCAKMMDPLWGYCHRRGRRAPGGPGHRLQFQPRQPVRHVRGHPRHCPLPHLPWPGAIRRPVQPHPGGGDAGGPHRLRRPQEEAGRRPGCLHRHRAQGGGDHPARGRHRQGVHRLPAGGPGALNAGVNIKKRSAAR